MALPNMDKRQLVIIIAAIACGVIASVLVGNFINAQINEGQQKLSYQFEKAQEQTKQQYQQDIALLNQRIAEVQANSKRAAEEAARAAAAAAQKPQGGAEAAAAPKKKASLALRTPAGKRAITVEIQSLVAVGGLINPGDFVDIIAHLNLPTGRKLDPKENVTAMIFQDLQVLAINTNIDEPGSYENQQQQKALKVTFAVEPQEAGLLAFAEQNGSLELTLRTPTEKGRNMIPTANWSTLGEYVLENSGADIKPLNGSDVSALNKAADLSEKPEIKVETENVQETKPYIQIFRGGKEL
ncbi:MAG: Flp pilus assembly protein CpaB [Candidatus Omnitrophota bacterium]